MRLKSRHDRRPELPLEPVWRFYPALACEFAAKHARVAAAAWRIFRIYRRVAADKLVPYADQAMMPVTAEDTQTLELFTHNQSAREAVDHARKVKELTGGPASSSFIPA